MLRMNTKLIGGTIVILLSITFISNFIHKYYKRKKSLKPKEVHEVIMFSRDQIGLKKSKYSRNVVTKSMSRLLFHLSSTQKTLDICMYVVTNMDLAYALIKLYHREVAIRLIVDADMAYVSGSCVKKIENRGIPVRWMKSTNLMHHKFCLLDASTDDIRVTPVVIMGSLNWTTQAVNGNWEDVVVTTQKDIVREYKNEFERLWINFKPIVNNVL